uniref:RNase H type-1 domain-containing protein n=1 Tax=Araucaria cunninghamii TaxID=56994 RepID=A0A0D6QWK3_ARACU
MIQETVSSKCQISLPMKQSEILIMQSLGFVENGPCPSILSEKRNVRHKMQRDGRWHPPPPGVFKINTDGSSRGNPGYAGIGGVGRESDGNACFIFSCYKGIHSNNYMEALAICSALEQGLAMGWQRIICESDSQIIINLLKTHHLDNAHWRLNLVVQQIFQICCNLEFISFVHIPREWNRVADCLAKWASQFQGNWLLAEDMFG